MFKEDKELRGKVSEFLDALPIPFDSGEVAGGILSMVYKHVEEDENDDCEMKVELCHECKQIEKRNKKLNHVFPMETEVKLVAEEYKDWIISEQNDKVIISDVKFCPWCGEKLKWGRKA